MELNENLIKKQMLLSKFEFGLYKKLVQLEQTFGFENKQILFNLQISGGKDSMCLLHAFHRVYFSKVCSLKNKYFLIVQHFNHKQRAQESDDDAFFVANEAFKLGLPVYLKSLPPKKIEKNLQNQFRNWRKEQAQKLSQQIAQDLNCPHFFIVTAHHARDHVETVLLHLLRGSGESGLKGISLFDQTNTYFRPFSDIPYAQVQKYCKEFNIKFREDSSNSNEKYARNYIRHNILPHFEHLKKDYENSFVKLSNRIQFESSLDSTAVKEVFVITESTTVGNLYDYFKSINLIKDISENCLRNILHEASILLKNKENFGSKKILLKNNRVFHIIKNGNSIFIDQFKRCNIF